MWIIYIDVFFDDIVFVYRVDNFNKGGSIVIYVIIIEYFGYVW